MLERIKNMLIKEFLQLFRDPRMRSILLVVPIFQTLIFGYAVTTDVRNIRTAVYDLDNSPASREVADAFGQSGYFNIDYHIDNDKDAQYLLDSGKVLTIIRMNQGFQGDLLSGTPAPLQVIIDGTDGNSARIIQDYVGKITAHLSQNIVLDTFSKQHGPLKDNIAIQVDSRAWFNEELESRNYFIPGIISTILTLVTLTMTSMSIVREKEIGTMEQILVTPIKKIEFILGKSVPFSLIAIFDVIAIMTVAAFWFEVPIRGSLLVMFIAVGCYLLTILGVGFFISSISYTQQQALMGTFFFYFPMVLLSGFLFPIANMPEAIQWITYLNPLRYFVTIIRSVFLKGVGLEILWPQMIVLAMMGLFTIGLATRRFHKTLT
ncbi:MAG: ABC transporter permease [Chlamydiales bacterium]|nr:ABC transporter permease [Chlamydiia bacterium]MCP5507354.1 ABC transporter permease [Chlamydiales bacterium]